MSPILDFDVMKVPEVNQENAWIVAVCVLQLEITRDVSNEKALENVLTAASVVIAIVFDFPVLADVLMLILVHDFHSVRSAEVDPNLAFSERELYPFTPDKVCTAADRPPVFLSASLGLDSTRSYETVFRDEKGIADIVQVNLCDRFVPSTGFASTWLEEIQTVRSDPEFPIRTHMLPDDIPRFAPATARSTFAGNGIFD